jgi:hypothetical protein
MACAVASFIVGNVSPHAPQPYDSPFAAARIALPSSSCGRSCGRLPCRYCHPTSTAVPHCAQNFAEAVRLPPHSVQNLGACAGRE